MNKSYINVKKKWNLINSTLKRKKEHNSILNMKLFEHEYLLNTIRRTSKVISNSTRSEMTCMMVTLTSVITAIMIM